jgi:hypothetical protein
MRFLSALVFSLCCGGLTFAQTPTRQPASGQPAAPAAPSPVPQIAVATDAREVREELAVLLSRYPPEVGRILKMDPTMLRNTEYLAQYPAIQQFLSAHPEIARNPSFYLEFVRQGYDYTEPTDAASRAVAAWGRTMESFTVFTFVVFISAMVAWLVKTVLNHRRWLRTSRVQTEVHNKLLDRFAGTNELLTYVQTSAGRRFLEAAPIPVEASADRPVGAPLNRVLWSVQAGIVLIAGGFGFQFVSGRLMPEIAQGMWTLGVLATAFGLGFVAAGAFSYVMSRRLGLLEPQPPLVREERGDSSAI